MTDPTKTKQVLSTGRRNGWAAGKSMYVGTYTGV